jgi:hypothetical protein
VNNFLASAFRPIRCAAQLDRSDELDGVGSCDRVRPAEVLAHPWDRPAILEPQNDLGAHSHPPPGAADDAEQVNLILLLGHRHEIGDRYGAIGCLKPSRCC